MFIVYVQKMTSPRSCENEIKVFLTTWCFYTETEGLRWKELEPLHSTQAWNKSAVDDFSITEFYRCDHWYDSGLHS